MLLVSKMIYKWPHLYINPNLGGLFRGSFCSGGELPTCLKLAMLSENIPFSCRSLNFADIIIFYAIISI